MTAKIKRRVNANKKLNTTYDNFELLLTEIDKKEIPYDLLSEINQRIIKINDFDGAEKKLIKNIDNHYSEILKQLKDRLNITIKNYYQNYWMTYGISIFGLPIGVILFAITKKPAFILIGLPIGLSIGLAVGMIKDKKVKEENRQIQIGEF